MQNRPKCYGIIPARYGSTRFMGKPLADILGKPMFWHVFKRANQCEKLSSITLATDDKKIFSAAKKLNVPVVMTSKDHQSGTDRVLEAARLINVPEKAIVVNIQGDEPAIEPAMLSELVQPFIFSDTQVTTLAQVISLKEAENPNQVKVVCADNGQALYFSRSLIPYNRGKTKIEILGHIGLYAFRMDILKKYSALSPGKLESAEKLEQLRLLENNIPILVKITKHKSFGVDTPEDIKIVTKLLKKNMEKN